MTTPIKTTLGTWIACKVPDDAYDFEIYEKESLPTALIVYTKHEHFKPGLPQPIVIPKGEWGIVGRAWELTEEQWKGIVAPLWNGFYNYLLINEPVGNYKRLVKETATESGHSLLNANGIYQSNPHTKPDEDDYSFYTHVNLSVQEEWQQAQTKVYNPLILKLK